MRPVELARQAVRDLRRIKDSSDRERVQTALVQGLAADPPPENLDIEPLSGRPPWRRLRVGNWRIVYRPLTQDELARLGSNEAEGYLVARIVNRRDLQLALRTLEL